jgi:alpha-galactosidase
MRALLLTFFLFSAIAIAAQEKKQIIRLDELDLSLMSSGWGEARKNASVSGKPLSVGGKTFEHGIGTHAVSCLKIDLHGDALEFVSLVGVDDNSGGKGKLEFILVGDDSIIWRSGILRKGGKAIPVQVSLKRLEYLGMLVLDGNNGIDNDHADWVEPVIICQGERPVAVTNREQTSRGILTPPAPEYPRINGPTIYGVRKNSPVIYRIPVTGIRPMHYEVSNLPDGLHLDQAKGIITGKISTDGNYRVKIKAMNEKGTDSLFFTFAVGNTLALTPPMGWNSWYIHYDRVSDSLMRQAADAMISSGMADYGYSYVNIDDCWMVKVDSKDPQIGGPLRTEQGELLTNKRFPDMNSLTDYIHTYGLKAGTYISPGPRTCGGYAGSYLHEEQDAATFARWGFDFLKYDWCSYQKVKKGYGRKAYIRPYTLMWSELQKQDRDIVLNLCQYGMKDVWKWGASVGNSWRTTGDLGLEDSKGSMPPFYSIGIQNAKHWEYAHPGAWNDPDYILIGWVGSAFKMGQGVKTKLTEDEQYVYMSMWSLMAAPLVFSGDMGRLDPFTLNVLCNSEVIAINQDVLGKQARVIRQNDHELILVKDLEDGTKAVGIFNTGTLMKDPVSYFSSSVAGKKIIQINAGEIGMTGYLKARDVWRQKNVGNFMETFAVEVPAHGVVLLRIRPATDGHISQQMIKTAVYKPE